MAGGRSMRCGAVLALCLLCQGACAEEARLENSGRHLLQGGALFNLPC